MRFLSVDALTLGFAERYHESMMSASTQQIERAIRELPVQEMVTLHEHLIATIHEREAAKGLDPAFRKEIKRRVESIESGSAKSVDAFGALKKM